MITTCTGCQTRYRLEDAKVPRRLIRVRCPSCKSVFLMDGTQAGQPEPPEEALVLERSAESFNLASDSAGSAAPPTLEPALEPARETTVETAAPTPPPAVVEPPAPAEAPAARVDEDAAGGEGAAKRRRRDKSEMLARALVSDILVYNRETRDKALSEGNLLEALGPEIKKSWELYKEKVTPEVANSTTHFRDALNEILAEGQKVF